LLCQITTKANKDRFSIPILLSDFREGNLPVDSNIRPNKIFTADKSIIIRKAGSAKEVLVDKVIDAIVAIVKS
jgi:mRNA interferase MazF